MTQHTFVRERVIVNATFRETGIWNVTMGKNKVLEVDNSWHDGKNTGDIFLLFSFPTDYAWHTQWQIPNDSMIQFSVSVLETLCVLICLQLLIRFYKLILILSYKFNSRPVWKYHPGQKNTIYVNEKYVKYVIYRLHITAIFFHESHCI